MEISPTFRSEEQPQAPKDQSGAHVCEVCSKLIGDLRSSSTCRNCNKVIHVSWAQNEPDPDCSRMAPTPMNCGVSFVCTPCYQNLGFA